MSFVDLEPEKLIDASIFELLGIDDASQEQKNKIMADVTRTIQNRVVARILDSLSEDDTAQFEKALDEGDEATKAFLATHNVDATKLATEEAITYKVELLAMVESAEENKKNINTNG